MDAKTFQEIRCRSARASCTWTDGGLHSPLLPFEGHEQDHTTAKVYAHTNREGPSLLYEEVEEGGFSVKEHVLEEVKGRGQALWNRQERIA